MAATSTALVTRARIARSVAVALAASVLTTVTPVAPWTPSVAGADPAGPVAQVIPEKVRYDRYEPIVADGVIGFFNRCPGGGVKDYIYPWADIYIIRGLNPSGGLTDVNGKPNAVPGFGGGGFIGEVLGYAGVGGLTAGTYTIVVDECQDGRLDPTDSVFPAAFRVSTRTSVSPLIGIGTLKANAGKRALEFEKRGRAWQALLKMEEALGYASNFVGNPALFAIAVGVGQFIQAQAFQLATARFPDPKKVAAVHLTNAGRRYRGIESDPPDPNYLSLTTLGPVTTFTPVHDGATFDSGASLIQALGTEEALAAALLRSIERYQGAAAKGDGTWALRHARQAQEFARLLADQLPQSATAANAAAAAIENDTRPIEQTLDDLGGALDAAFASGLTVAQEAAIVRSGLTRAQVVGSCPSCGVWSSATSRCPPPQRTCGHSRRTQRTSPSRSTRSQTPTRGSSTAWRQTRSRPTRRHALMPEVRTRRRPALPFLSTPVGSRPGDLPIASFAWDLDGDGSFDDATGAVATFTPGTPRHGLVGVRVTDTAGEVGVDYARLTVTGAAELDAISTPAGDALTVQAGATEQFQLTSTGATVTWFVDGVQAATGPSFVYAPTVGGPAGYRPGAHEIRAEAIAGELAVARDWTVFVVSPDSDGDGYPDDVDCGDNDPSVFPGAPELADGKDNDCNPASLDGGATPVAEAGNAISGSEGAPLALVGAKVTPSGATAPFAAAISWGDGTTSNGTVTANNIIASHVYRDNGTYSIEVCATSAGNRRDCDTTDAVVTNAAATPNFATLFGWKMDPHTTRLNSSQGVANWVVAPNGLSVLQTINSDPSFFIADTPLIASEVTVSIRVETTGDDDFIGFVLGAQQGFMQPGANPRFLLVDWKQTSQGGGCATAIAGLAVSLVEGLPTASQLWSHLRCGDATSSVTELQRATTLGTTGWAEQHDLQLPDQLHADTAPGLGEQRAAARSRQHRDRNSVPDRQPRLLQLLPGCSPLLGLPADGGVRRRGDSRTVPAAFIDPAPPTRTPAIRLRRRHARRRRRRSPRRTVRNCVGGAHVRRERRPSRRELCLTDDDGGAGCQSIVVDVAQRGARGGCRAATSPADRRSRIDEVDLHRPRHPRHPPRRDRLGRRHARRDRRRNVAARSRAASTASHTYATNGHVRRDRCV